MKIGVVGAGSVGGVIAASLKKAGFDVSILARQGEHLAAIKTQGLTIIDKDGNRETHKIKASSNSADLGKQDLVIVSIKGHDILPAVKNISELLNEKTTVVFVMNGIPWWYMLQLKEKFSSSQNDILNSDEIKKYIPPEKVLSGVIYISTGITAPGEITNKGGRRLMFGEPSGKITERLKRLTEIFEKAGMRPIATENIQKEIWLKLWGNITFNPLSVITKMGMEDIANHPEVSLEAKKIMLEMKNITDKLGLDLGMSVEERLLEGKKSGNHKTSTLQDFEKGKKLELDGLIGAVIEIAEMLETNVPTIRDLNYKMKELAKIN